MSAIVVASQEPKAGRTAVAAGLAAYLAGQGKSVQVARLLSADGPDPVAEDDARTLAAIPGTGGSPAAISEQDAVALVRDAGGSGVAVIEAPAGAANEVASRLSARVVFVTNDGSDVASAKLALGAVLAGVVATRVASRRIDTLSAEIAAQGVSCFAVLPEDRLLAGPNVQEMTQALHASPLVERGPGEEAVEYLMLGPISADPGQPYLQHGSKAVVNRFDKMDLHLAALATEPDCLILTGGQMPSPYLLDRVSGSDFDVTVLLAPDSTVRTVEVLDELFGSTRFAGQRKLDRAIELMRDHIDAGKLAAAL